MPAIKNIIFDFGNVLFDIDLPSIEQNFRLLKADSFEKAWQYIRENRVMELYETGGISTAEFIDQLRFTGNPVSEAEVVSAWNGIFIDLPRHRLDLMLSLRQHFQVFLLSNINELHEQWIADYVRREHGIDDYESRFFDGVYFSHLVRLRKPDRAIFEYMLADAEIKAEESIFFDDLPANIAAAREVGIASYLHPPALEIGDHVERVLSGKGSPSTVDQ